MGIIGKIKDRISRHPTLVRQFVPPKIKSSELSSDARLVLEYSGLDKIPDIKSTDSSEGLQNAAKKHSDSNTAWNWHKYGDRFSEIIEEVLSGDNLGNATFARLDDINRALGKDSDASSQITMREQFYRCVALLRLGRYHDAARRIDLIDSSSNKNPESKDLRSFSMNVHFIAAALHSDAGKDAKGNVREEHFKNAQYHMLRAEEAAAEFAAGRELDVPHEKLEEVDEKLRDRLFHFRVKFAQRLMNTGYTDTAHTILSDLLEYYPGDEYKKAVFDPLNGFHKILFTENGDVRLKTKEELRAEAKSFEGRLSTAREIVHHALSPDRKSAIKYAVGGTAVAMGGQVLLGGAQAFDLNSAMAASGVGALVGLGVGMTRAALKSPEVREVRKTGISDLTNTDLAADLVKRIAKLGAAYVAFGGIVPGAATLEDISALSWLVQHADASSAQLIGPGNITAYVGDSFVHHGHSILQNIQVAGPIDGLANYWNGLREWSATGATLHQVLDFWSTKGNGLAAKDVSNGINDIFTNGSFASQALFAYQVLTGAYYTFDLFLPKISGRVKSKIRRSKIMEFALLPAAWFLGRDISQACGVERLDAKIISSMGLVQQFVFHVAGGGKITNMDLANTGRNAALLGMYAGWGKQMIPKKDGPKPISEYIGNSVGIQVGFIPIMVLDWLLLRQNGERVVENKFTRGVSLEHASNGLAIYIDFASWKGTLAKELIGNFINHGWMSRTYNTFTGSPQQRAGLIKSINSGNAESMMKDMRVAMRRWPFGAPVFGSRLTENIAPLLAFWYSASKAREPFETRPDYEFISSVYDMVDRFDETTAENFIRGVENNLRNGDQRDRDVMTGLLLSTYAARNGTHGEKIRDLFDKNPQAFDHGIPEDLPEVPYGKSARREYFEHWMNQAQGIVQSPGLVFPAMNASVITPASGLILK